MGQRLGVPKNYIAIRERQLYRELLKYVTDIKVDTSGKVHCYLKKDEVPNIKIPTGSVFVNVADIVSSRPSFLDLLFEAEKSIVRVSPTSDNTKYLLAKKGRVSVRRSDNTDEITWIMTKFKDPRGRYLKSTLEHRASKAYLTSTKLGRVILMCAPGNDYSYFKLFRNSNNSAMRMNLFVHGYQDWYLYFNGIHKVVYKDIKNSTNTARYEFNTYTKLVFLFKEHETMNSAKMSVAE